MSKSEVLSPDELIYRNLTSAEKEVAERIISVVEERLVESSAGISMKRAMRYGHNIRFPKKHLLKDIHEKEYFGSAKEGDQVNSVKKPVETYVKYYFRSAGWERVEFLRESDQLKVRIVSSSGNSPRKKNSK